MSDTINIAITLLVLPTLTFALVYSPVASRLPRVDSTYPKADVTRRILAAAVDASLLGGCLYFYLNAGSAWFAAAGGLYLGARDSVGGRSVGKFLAGLFVLSLDTGKPSSVGPSIRRNLVFLFPGVNVAAAILETAATVRDPLGYRLGDLIAHTQVVEGFGAKDLAASFLRWIGEPAVGGRGRSRPAITVAPGPPRLHDSSATRVR